MGHALSRGAPQQVRSDTKRQQPTALCHTELVDYEVDEHPIVNAQSNFITHESDE